MAKLARRAASDGAFSFVASEFANDPGRLDAWVRGVFRFRPEYEELLRDPLRALSDVEAQGFFEGDCDDVSMFYAAALCGAVQYHVRFVAIRLEERNPEFEHVFVEAVFNGQTVVFDGTAPPGTVVWEVERMVVNVC